MMEALGHLDRPLSPAAAKLFYFDQEAANRALRFFERVLTHTKGEHAGQPFILEQWQARVIGELFGWRRRADGSRRYRKAYFEIPRKNGKSTLGAGIALYLLLADGEPGAEVYTAAADRDQASIVYDMAAKMADQSEVLRPMVKAYRASKTLEVASTGSKMKALSSDAFTKHGLSPSGVIFDELHAQPNRELFDVLATAQGARHQPLIVSITTAGYDRQSLCWHEREYAVRVRSGLVEDPSFLTVIFAADEDDDWTDPEVWAKANPCLGVSLRHEYVEEACRRAQESPVAENTFRQLHLNQWTEQAVRWLQMARWDDCDAPVDERELRGETCFAGLDLASTTDLSALGLVFPPREHGQPWRIAARFWLPSDDLVERERRDRVPYRLWAKEGLISLTPGNVTDYDVIRRDIGVLGEQFDIREIAVDRWNATQITTQLEGDGFEMVPFGQGFASMSAPTRELERLVISGGLAHGGHPVLRWMAGNAAATMDAAGNVKLDKKKSTARIDGIIGVIMGLGQAIAAPEFHGSIYDSREPIVL
jgi:phage terminase large subunit-like protein